MKPLYLFFTLAALASAATIMADEKCDYHKNFFIQKAETATTYEESYFQKIYYQIHMPDILEPESTGVLSGMFKIGRDQSIMTFPVVNGSIVVGARLYGNNSVYAYIYFYSSSYYYTSTNQTSRAKGNMVTYDSSEISIAYYRNDSRKYIQVWLNPNANPENQTNFTTPPQDLPSIFQQDNLMRNASAIQSSSPYGDQGGALKAIDGNKNCSWSYTGGYNSVTHTETEYRPFWQADLGTERYVNRVVIYNREDCCKERLTNYKVYVTNEKNITNLSDARSCGGIQNGAGSISCGFSGRYITIQIQGQGILSLCEVEAFST